MIHRRGSIFAIIIGLLAVMLILALSLSRRFSGQARLVSVADQATIARYFLESYAGDVLWQIRRGRNDATSKVFPAFRGGTTVPVINFDYRPSSMIAELARDLRITLGPDDPVAYFAEVKTLPYDAQAFRVVKANEEKRGLLGIVCQITYEKRVYTLDQQIPFKVVLPVTPVLRKFVLFLDQLHLEQEMAIGDQDAINIMPIRRNYVRDNSVPLTLFGQPGAKARERNGKVFLGSDEKKIYLNLVGGLLGGDQGRKEDRTDLWQISPSAFDATAGHETFQVQELMRDEENKPLLVRGAGIPLVYQGHYARFGLLGYSEEIGDPSSSALGDFKLNNFLKNDPSFVEYQRSSRGLTRASALRLQGDAPFGLLPADIVEKMIDSYRGYERDIYGKVFARFFLLSFFFAPSVGSPIHFSDNPDQELSFDQYGNAEMITFKPKSGRYGNYMSRIVSGGKAPASLGREANIPLNRNSDYDHKLLEARDFPECDGLRLAGPFSRVGEAWFGRGPFDGPGGRPRLKEENITSRICRHFRTQSDFKKAVGLSGPDEKRCWVDGVVYVHEPLTLREGITCENVRGGVVLVKGPIVL
ncbi:MAG TPA: Tad domain-containing protein, partial [Candidatus Ozemobacteraceae bacterium]|nr:Tad domain-containing protein [Candidatus Ozemobacteraceae bacterium]